MAKRRTTKTKRAKRSTKTAGAKSKAKRPTHRAKKQRKTKRVAPYVPNAPKPKTRPAPPDTSNVPWMETPDPPESGTPT